MQIYRVGVPAVRTEYKLQNKIATSQNKSNKHKKKANSELLLESFVK
jgi:hypothetical protein